MCQLHSIARYCKQAEKTRIYRFPLFIPSRVQAKVTIQQTKERQHMHVRSCQLMPTISPDSILFFVVGGQSSNQVAAASGPLTISISALSHSARQALDLGKSISQGTTCTQERNGRFLKWDPKSSMSIGFSIINHPF